jgi:uncharacterized membrane protein
MAVGPVDVIIIGFPGNKFSGQIAPALMKLVDAGLVRVLDLLLLLVVVFLPFPTTLITEAFDDRDAERVAATVFGLTLLAIRLLGMALDGYARRERLYADFAADEELTRSRRKDASGVVLYLIAIVVGLVLPGVAVAVYFAIALDLVIPFRELTRLRVRDTSA